MRLDAVERRYIDEVGAMNIAFVYQGRHIRTPTLSGSILAGVTRESILQLAPDLGFTIEEARIDLEEVLRDVEAGTITEAFGMGTGAVIAPVGRLVYQGREAILNGFEPGPAARTLYEALTAIQYGRRPDPYGWTRVVGATAAGSAWRAQKNLHAVTAGRVGAQRLPMAARRRRQPECESQQRSCETAIAAHSRSALPFALGDQRLRIGRDAAPGAVVTAPVSASQRFEQPCVVAYIKRGSPAKRAESRGSHQRVHAIRNHQPRQRRSGVYPPGQCGPQGSPAPRPRLYRGACIASCPARQLPQSRGSCRGCCCTGLHPRCPRRCSVARQRCVMACTSRQVAQVDMADAPRARPRPCLQFMILPVMTTFMSISW